MNEKPESQSSTEQTDGDKQAPGVLNRKPAKAKQPSFDEVMQAAVAPPEKPSQPPPPKKPEPEVKKAAVQPSFEEIMAGVTAAPGESGAEARRPQPGAPGQGQGEARGDRRPPGPRSPRKEERKMPVVVRKIPLSQLQGSLSRPPRAEGGPEPKGYLCCAGCRVQPACRPPGCSQR